MIQGTSGLARQGSIGLIASIISGTAAFLLILIGSLYASHHFKVGIPLVISGVGCAAINIPATVIAVRAIILLKKRMRESITVPGE